MQVSRWKNCMAFPFFPLPFVLYPFFHLVAENLLKSIDILKLMVPFSVSMLVTAAAWGTFIVLYRSVLRASIVTSLMALNFFSYGHLFLVYLGNLGLHPRVISGIFIFIFLITPVLGFFLPASFRSGWGRVLSVYLNIAAIILCILPLGRVFFEAKINFNDDITPTFEAPVLKKIPEKLPDIYYILLDEYGRKDILKREFGLDITPFEDYLKNRGFFVAERPNSNYGSTIYSLSSSLSFDFLPERISEPEMTEDIRNSRVYRALRPAGYRYFFVSSGVTMTEFSKQADKIISYRGSDDVRLLFFNSTLLRAYSAFFLSEDWRARHLYDFEELGKVPDAPGPKFVFAHMLIPHPPMVFNEDGSTFGAFTIGLTPHGNIPSSMMRYRTGYPGQVEYLNVLLKDLVEKLLSKSKTPPVIILQSDHGMDPLTDTYEDPHSLYMRMANFTAIYGPPELLNEFYPEITPVNIFRILLDHDFGTGLGRLPDKIFLPEFPEGETEGRPHWKDVSELARKPA